MIAHLLLFCLAAPPDAAAYPIYMRVPFANALAELLYAEAVAGKVALPADYVVKDAQVWRKGADGKPFVVPALLLTNYALGCRYDNDGHFFVPLALYQQIKGRLIQHHQGRLESFLIPDPKREPGQIPRFDDLDAWESYIWDATDRCWRWPFTLGRVDTNHKLRDGRTLSRLRRAIPGDLPTGRLEELVREYGKRVQAKLRGKPARN